MKNIRMLLLIGPLVLSPSISKADSVTGSGTWGPNTPTTTESAPGDTWSFAFQLSDPVTDACCGNGLFQTEQFSDFTYLLNGTPITPTLTTIIFYAAAGFGMFDMGLSDGNLVTMYGDQVYAGNPPPDATFIPGVYAVSSAMNDAALGVGTGSGTVTISTAPEPASLALLGFGAFAAMLARRKTAAP